jgi:hypothetical protein
MVEEEEDIKALKEEVDKERVKGNILVSFYNCL